MANLIAHVEFLHPRWIPLVATILVVAWVAWSQRSIWKRVFPSLQVWLRLIAAGLLTMSATGLVIRYGSSERWMVVLIDRSDSIGESSRKVADSYVDDLVAKHGSRATTLLPFASSAVQNTDSLPPDAKQSWSGETNLASAVASAVGVVPNGYVPEFVLLTDGAETRGDLVRAAIGVPGPVSIVPLPVSEAKEIAVLPPKVPPTARPYEVIPIVAEIRSTVETEATVVLSRDDQVVEQRKLPLKAGRNDVRFEARTGSDAMTRFAIAVTDANDSWPENDRAKALVCKEHEASVLVVGDSEVIAASFAKGLQEQHCRVDVVSQSEWSPDERALSAYDVVVLCQLPTEELTTPQTDVLEQYLRQWGGGVIAIGGEEVFGAAAYRGSALEQLMPVSAAQRSDEVVPVMAMVLIIDRSESMKADNRIGLAKDAARRSIQILDPQDKVGIIAFGEESVWVSPITELTETSELLRQIRTIEPSGGTKMFPALQRAFLALEQTVADRRHVVLLTDGAAAPGDFQELARQMKQADITVSTVAIGGGAERTFLLDIKDEADGRHYDCANSKDIPRILAEETRTAKGETNAESIAPHVLRRLPGLNIDDAPPLGSYAPTDPIPDAEVLLTTPDADPLVAWRRLGNGISVSFTSDIADRGASSWKNWKGNGPFWLRLVHHAMRQTRYPRLQTDLQRYGGRATLTIDAYGADAMPMNDATVRINITTPDPQSVEHVASQIAPGRYETAFAAEQIGEYVLNISVSRTNEDQGLTAMRAMTIDYRDELRATSADIGRLRSIAATTGGEYNPSVDELLAKASARQVDRTLPLWRYLLIGAMGLLLVDVVLRRQNNYGGRA